MLTSARAALTTAGLAMLLVAACGSPPPPKPRAKQVVDDAPDPQSSEWLYATKGLNRSDLGSECLHVKDVIVADSKCQGEACTHASRLSQDWLNRCRKSKAEAISEVSELARVYAERRGGARVPCLREIEPILKEGCSSTPDCAEVAQAWTTRCADASGSPLVVRILEAKTRVKLDKRGCSELASELGAAAGCVQKFQCEDGLAAVDLYRKRCLVSAAPGLVEGMAELAIRLGAGHTVKPLPIQPALVELAPARFPLPLAEGHGVVTLVCGERPTSLTSYLEVRRNCQEGEIVMLRRHAGRSKDAATLQVGRFPHASDTVFASSYPSLMVRGEAAARRSVTLSLLSEELTAVANRLGSGSDAEAEISTALIRALTKARSMLRSSASEPTLAEVDAALSPHFKRLALAKLAAAKKLFKPGEHAGFMRRSLKRPLADLDESGQVLAGASNGAAAIDLGSILPKSSALYLAELKTLAERVAKQALSEKQKAAADQALAEALAACSAAQNKVRESETDLRECGFGAGCDDELMTELNRDLGTSHRDSSSARTRFVLAQGSLDPSPEPVAGEPRCLEPWW
jgi:hypothetical protein